MVINTILRETYKRKQIVKFLIAGGLATFVDLGSLYFFTSIMGIWYLISSVFSFILAFFVSFFLQKFWTFRDDNKKVMYRQMGIYLGMGLMNLCINSAGMFVLVEKANLVYMTAQIIMVACIGISNFLIDRFIIFRKRKKAVTDIYDSKPKILIATGIYPPDIGGPATVVKDLAEELAKNNFHVAVLTYSKKENMDYERNEGAYSVYRVNKDNIKFISKMLYFINIFKLSLWADLIYATDTYSVGYFVCLLKKYLGIKYVIRFVGDSAWETALNNKWITDFIMDFQSKTYGQKIEELKLRQKMILINADAVIVVSRFLKKIARKIGVKEDRIKLIYNSVDIIDKNFNSAETEKIRSRYGQGAKIVTTVCRLTPWKGVDGIIKTMPKLIESTGKINLLVLGDGSEKSALEKMAGDLNVGKSVFFLGKIKHENIVNYLKASDLFILNSNYEGLSHTLLEAMKAQAPIITSNIGGNPEVITSGKNGLLVGYNNEAELYGAAVKILSDKNYADFLVKNASEKVKLFNWRENVAKTIAVINKCLEK